MTTMREALSNGPNHVHGGWRRTGGVNFFNGTRMSAYRCGASTCGHEEWREEAFGGSNPPPEPGQADRTMYGQPPVQPVGRTIEQRREAIHEIVRRAQQTGRELGLMVSGGGGPRPDGSWSLGLSIRFPEDGLPEGQPDPGSERKE